VTPQWAAIVGAGDRIRWALIANPVSCEFRRGERGRRVPLPPDRWGEWVARCL